MTFSTEFGNNIYKPVLEKVFFKPFSKPLAKLFAKANLSPNFVSLVGLLLMFSASLVVTINFKNHLLVAALLVYFSFLFDKIDGDLARLQGKAGSLGQYFEGFLDLFGDMSMAIALALFSGFDNIILVALTVAAPLIFYYNHLSSSLYLNLLPSTYRESQNSNVLNVLKVLFSYNRVRHELLFIVVLLTGKISYFFYIMPLLVIYSVALYTRTLWREYHK